MLQKLLELDDLGDNLFCSQTYQRNFRNALFGGQAVAQALMAAGRTAKSRPPHSLHSYFLRPGKADKPIYYQVEILRDGRSVSTRSVKAVQDDKLIFSMQASFHCGEQGYTHTITPAGIRQEPEELRSNFSKETRDYLERNAENLSLSALDFVPFNGNLISHKASTEPHLQFWLKSSEALENSALFHYCALAFASDIGLLATALLSHDTHLFGGDVLPASMDHSIWFHKQPDFNQWNRYITRSPWAGGGRALCKGEFFNFDDELVASVAQEGIIRKMGTG